jgi:hypothetical protein
MQEGCAVLDDSTVFTAEILLVDEISLAREA